jgi:hypothetical protein
MEESGRFPRSGVKWSVAPVSEIQQFVEGDGGAAEAMAASLAGGWRALIRKIHSIVAIKGGMALFIAYLTGWAIGVRV